MALPNETTVGGMLDLYISSSTLKVRSTSPFFHNLDRNERTQAEARRVLDGGGGGGGGFLPVGKLFRPLGNTKRWHRVNELQYKYTYTTLSQERTARPSSPWRRLLHHEKENHRNNEITPPPPTHPPQASHKGIAISNHHTYRAAT